METNMHIGIDTSIDNCAFDQTQAVLDMLDECRNRYQCRMSKESFEMLMHKYDVIWDDLSMNMRQMIDEIVDIM